MTYFSLRKQDPETEPDEAAEDVVEAQDEGDEQGTEEAPAVETVGAIAAFRQGVAGYFTWWAARIGYWAYLIHFIAVWAVFHYANRWVPVGVCGALAFGISLFMPREWFEGVAARLDARSARFGGRRKGSVEAETDGPQEATQEAPGDPLAALMRSLIGEAPGVHLKTLTEALAKGAAEAGSPAPSKADVERALEARQIPLRDSVRDTRRKVNRGVHREDLEAYEKGLSPAPTAPPATGV